MTMTMADIQTAMQQIQSQLAVLNAQNAAASTGNSASAATFADALSGATATDATTKTADSVSSSSTGAVTGEDIVAAAEKYIGTPYVFGGESSSGMDCSGLVQTALKDVGISAPRLVHEQQTIGTKVDSLKDAQPGDLIVLNGGDHIAIYAGDGKVVHAPYAGRTVSLQKDWFTDKDIVTIRRVVPTETDSTAASSTTGSSGSTMTPADQVKAAQALVQLQALQGSTGDSDSSTSSSLASLLGDSSSTSDSSSSSSASYLSSLLSSLGSSNSSSSSTAQLLAARAALLEGSSV